MINKLSSSSPRSIDIGLLILRLGMGGLLMINHGLPKFDRLLQGNVEFMQFLGLDPSVSLTMAALGEALFGLFVVLGVRLRITTIPPIFVMCVAINHLFAGNILKDNELALVFLFGLSTLFFTGAGKYSLDALFEKKNKK